ncbi:MAG: TraR/DksA C4-type zinc finger protein [Ideonella sp.]|jgi:DnaK suppressor protein|nr:TraR/DksA C4-type zinc finger protein [Ideonella sp.]MBL0150475.1 TraR/DksA C4-type zinc finger protein [Ideonella sp.]
MTTHLSSEQRQQLGKVLRDREQTLRAHLKALYDGVSRVDHAREILLQDGDDAPQRDADREIDMAVSDLETVELTRIEQALSRLQHGSYGECVDCGDDVPFERLALEPHTLRCVLCESKRERFQPRSASM